MSLFPSLRCCLECSHTNAWPTKCNSWPGSWQNIPDYTRNLLQNFHPFKIQRVLFIELAVPYSSLIFRYYSGNDMVDHIFTQGQGSINGLNLSESSFEVNELGQRMISRMMKTTEITSYQLGVAGWLCCWPLCVERVVPVCAGTSQWRQWTWTWFELPHRFYLQFSFHSCLSWRVL